ncbi:monocyte to macrophage differentiation factor 2 [Camelus ferus]|nr:monocyte to macrophage differentiation factor 2 [Camelus ferus]
MNHRVPAHKRYQPTEYEHAANCATHALWIIPSILGSSNLYFLSDDDWETISAWIYGLGLCGLFVVSTVFHTISWKKSHLRTVEHCLHMSDRMVIYFFIAASYAPWNLEHFCAVSLCGRLLAGNPRGCVCVDLKSGCGSSCGAGAPACPVRGPRLCCCYPRQQLNLRELGPWASHMRWLVWIMASVGTVYVFFFHERYKLVELLCYTVTGFLPALVILSMPNTEGIWELLTGGVFYCLGMVFFKSDGRIPFAHAIWHLFVAFGAGTHYYAIWRYLYLPSTLQAKVSK